jgi:radical SAM superfamily enzyme YgiQ (UPF0313 family)
MIGLPGETRETINHTITFAKELDVQTIQVSVAHAYPGTELHHYLVQNGFLVFHQNMVDQQGHQLAHISYPRLPGEEMLSALHRFYDEYYFRPKAVYRILKRAVFDSRERNRIYKEARSFLEGTEEKAVRDAPSMGVPKSLTDQRQQPNLQLEPAPGL